MNSSSVGHESLGVLVGRWKTEGTAEIVAGAQAARIDAIDTYEWLPGGFGLLHVVDARVGDERVEGAEIIGYDSAAETYVTLSVGSDGSVRYEASLTQESDGLTWRMHSDATRFTGVFSDDGERIKGHWERRSDRRWAPWMEITLTKQDAPGD